MRTAIQTKIAIATLLGAMLASTANATVPVIDPSAIARIREMVSVGTQTLTTARQNLQTVNQMRNTIGQVGQGRIGGILQAAGLDFSGPQGLLNDVINLNSQIDDFGRSMGQLGVMSPQQLRTASQSFTGARNATAEIFYTPNANAENLTKLRNVRAAAVREAGVSGFGLALSTKGDMQRTAQTAERLTTQAQSSTDLRTDVQANTAALLAVYAELAKQTAVQTQLLEIEAAKTLASDTRTSR